MKIFLQIHRLKISDKPDVIIRMYSNFRVSTQTYR